MSGGRRRCRDASGVMLLTSVLLMTSSASCAEPRRAIHEMFHNHWTMKEGVPGSISGITQTHDGFLWLSTANGLFRFDGNRFEPYMPGRGDPLSEDSLTNVYAPSDGGLWITYAKIHGASFIKDGENKAAFLNLAMFQIVRDATGQLWAVTERGLARRTQSSWQMVDPSWNYPDQHPNVAYVDARGTLWISSNDGLAFLPRGERRFRRANGLTGPILGIASANDANDATVWVSTGSPETLRAIDATNGVAVGTPIELKYPVYALLMRRDGSLWMTTTSHGIGRIADMAGIAIAIRRGARVHPVPELFEDTDGLTNDFVGSLYEDREGSVWVATRRGLDQFRPSALTPLDFPTAFKSQAEVDRVPMAPAIVAAESEGIVTSGRSGGLMRSGDRTMLDLPDRRLPITCAHRSASGELWFGSIGGLWRYAGGMFQWIALPDDLKDHRVQAVESAGGGPLWVSVGGYGVLGYGHGHWERLPELMKLKQHYTTALHEDASGRLWVGHMRDRLEWLENGVATLFDETRGLDVGNVYAFYERAGRVWIGGEAGLQLFRDGGFWRPSLENGYSLKNVTGIVETREGDLWLNTSAGVIRIAAGELARALHDASYRVAYRVFDYLDGLTSLPTDIRPLPTAVEDSAGRIFFATDGAVLWVDPQDVSRNDVVPGVVIRSVVSGDRHFVNDLDVKLAPNSENVAIDYTATSLLIPERVMFRYRMTGVDANWVDAGQRRQAYYSKLPPGSYSFQVIASNNDGLWNDAGATLRLTIAPSFVQTWLFKSLCIAAALGVLWLLYLARVTQVTGQLKDRMYARIAERERIARDLHDNVFQGIQGLFLAFHNAAQRLKKEDPLHAVFEELLMKSDRVMTEGRELVLDLRSQEHEPMDLASLLSEFARERSVESRFGFRVIVNGPTRELRTGVGDEVFSVGREALSNAFRHSAARNVEAEINFDPNELRVRIRDDGTGIDAEVLRHGSRKDHWGLPGMRERAAKIGATLDVWSGTDSGTEIDLRVPADVAYLGADVSRAWSSIRNLLGFNWRVRG